MNKWYKIALSMLLLGLTAGCGEGLVDTSNPEFVGAYTQLSSEDVHTPTDSDASDLVDSADVQPGTIGVGGPCIVDAECIPGLSCYRTPGSAGMCSRVCELADDDCPGTSRCVSNPDAGRPIPLCFQPCESACLFDGRLASCQSHTNFADAICLPLSCNGDAGCPAGSHCVLAGNYCQQD